MTSPIARQGFGHPRMQESPRRIVYPTRFGMVPWWILAGVSISGRILLIGDFNRTELNALSNISSELHSFEIAQVLDQAFDLTGVSTSRFDVIVIKALDSEHFASLPGKASGLGRLMDLAEIVLLLEPNYQHVSRWRRNPLAILRSLISDTRETEMKLRFAGRRLEKLETLSYHDQPREIFPKASYYTNKNSFLISEKIKHWLLNTNYSRMLFNSSIWVISSQRETFLESLRREIAANEGLEWQGQEVRFVKAIFCGMKIVVSFTSYVERKPECIVAVPLFETPLQQRINEKALVERLRKSSSIAELFVDKIVDGTVDQIRYFAMKEYSGVTVDCPDPRLTFMTSLAAATITRFVDCFSTAGGERPTASAEKLGAEYFAALLDRYPFHDPAIRRLESCFRGATEIPLVDFMHGDMKIENFVFDTSISSIIGIIDLELARAPGLPLFDLYYLISYNRELLHGETFYESFLRIANDDLSAVDRQHIDAYDDSVQLDRKQKLAILALFFLHHYSTRFMFSEEDRQTSEEFRLGCEWLGNLLDEPAST